MSITTRILLADMLDKNIPTELITGIVVLHAEDVTPFHGLAFMTRMYRQSNKDGFLKAFSDNAESFATGLSPLQTVMGELRIRKVELWPRFHKSIIRDLGQRKADVVELHQPLTRSMTNMQNAIVECLDATLNELKRTVHGVDIDNYNIDNAIFKTFDITVQRQLAPRWSSLGPKSKGLVKDLKELRTLLNYLVSYDCISFQQYLDTLRASQNKYASGAEYQNQSPWFFMDAANVLFDQAKARVYVGQIESEQQRAEREELERQEEQQRRTAAAQTAYEVDSDEEEAAGFAAQRPPPPPPRKSRRRPHWLPHGLEPVLEEQPKWHLLRDVLDEIEQEIYFTEDKANVLAPNNTVLIMTGDGRTCSQITQFLSRMKDSIIGQPDDAEDDAVEPEDVQAENSTRPARRMMMRQLWRYFGFEHSLSNVATNLKVASIGGGLDAGSTATTPATAASGAGAGAGGSNGAASSAPFESDALKRKQIWERGQGPPNKRRRQRGGGVTGSNSSRPADPNDQSDVVTREADDMAAFIERSLQTVQDGEDDAVDRRLEFEYDEDEEAGGDDDEDFTITGSNIANDFTEVEFDNFFGVLDMDTVIVVRPYRGDGDDYVLSELRPRYIIMYDPDPAFVRRIELYRATTPNVNPRVYFLMYAASVEEQKYLSSLRREKESFEKLIREKSTMALPLQADNEPVDNSADDRLLRTVNSRIAGGQKGVTNKPPTIIFDIRELGSDLPGLLHKAGMLVEPCTLQVGDYILSPEMCVERKSLPDLIQSFNSGRLASQAEAMSVHYQHPILLIEFPSEDHFNLSTFADTRTGGTTKAITSKTSPRDIDVQTKLVLLTMTFPRLRIIWSASPYHTSDIFAELKATYDEPDKAKVARIGVPVDDGDDDGDGAHAPATGNFDNTYNLIPESLLRCMPSVNATTSRHVMSQVRDLEELCELELDEVQSILGNEPGRKMWEFMQHDIKAKRGGRGRGAAAGSAAAGSAAGSTAAQQARR